jgi:hypothetical protein
MALIKAPMARSAPLPLFDGCFISPPGYKRFRAENDGIFAVTDGLMDKSRHFRTTGDPLMDRDLDRAIGVVADIFKVSPAFGFYDPQKYVGTGEAESWRMNAWATTEDTEIPGTRGTVAFGWDLFRSEYFDFDRTGTTIVTIIAHEFGHVVQGQRGLLDQLRTGFPRKSEINADFLAGYFLGLKKKERPSLSFKAAGDLFVRLGRLAEGNPTRTHGNSQERLDAAEAGFRASYLKGLDVEKGIAAGLEYLGLTQAPISRWVTW